MMKAGTYYVGDLCYVLDEVWDEVCDLMFAGKTTEYGEFELADGRKFAILGTAYGDGTYDSNVGTEHAVDSGTIGCILVEDINKVDESLGAKIEFPSDFEVFDDAGKLNFGHVVIDTDPEYEDEEEDWYEDEEEEDEDGLY